MPARKPAGLITRAETKAKKAARIAHESALKPRRDLSANAPARLAGHEVAAATWRRMMRVYNELEAQVVTMMDQDLLIDYCILTEQVGELDELRASSFAAWKHINNSWPTIEGTLFGKDLIDAIAKLQDAFTDVVKLDGRVDRKRALLLQLRQSLYMTPRARAGAAPKEKEVVAPPDEMEKLLNNAGIFVAGQDEGK